MTELNWPMSPHTKTAVEVRAEGSTSLSAETPPFAVVAQHIIPSPARAVPQISMRRGGGCKVSVHIRYRLKGLVHLVVWMNIKGMAKMKARKKPTMGLSRDVLILFKISNNCLDGQNLLTSGIQLWMSHHPGKMHLRQIEMN